MQSPTRICFMMEGWSLMFVFAYTIYLCFFCSGSFSNFLSIHCAFFKTFSVCPSGQNNLVFYQVLFEYSLSIVSQVLFTMNSTFSKQIKNLQKNLLLESILFVSLSISSPVCMCGCACMCGSVYKCMYVCAITCYSKQMLFLKR